MFKAVENMRILLSANVFLWHFFGILIKAGLIPQNYSILTKIFKGEESVYIFFIISGFLFGYIHKNINWRDFVIRRFRRLAPMYYVAVLVGIIVTMTFKNNIDGYFHLSDVILYYLFFMPQFAKYYHPEVLGYLDVLWSIGVEMMFYAIVPFIDYLKIKSLLVATVLFFFAIQFLGFHSWKGYLDFMVIGYTVGRFRKTFYYYGFEKAAVFSMSIFLLFLALPIDEKYYTYVLVFSFASFLMLMPFKTSEYKMKLWSLIAKNSYAFYIFHMFYIYGLVFLIPYLQLDLSLLTIVVLCIVGYSAINLVVYNIEKLVKSVFSY
ncbi:acyltransferase family protein [Schleiferiaceae bacterium]|nr:acyltransferase family protein [Schleiferiaceae bacterium]